MSSPQRHLNQHDEHSRDIGHHVQQLGNASGPTNSQDHGICLCATTGKSTTIEELQLRNLCNFLHCPTPSTCCCQQRACRQRVRETANHLGSCTTCITGTSTTCTGATGETLWSAEQQDHGNRPLHRNRKSTTCEELRLRKSAVFCTAKRNIPSCSYWPLCRASWACKRQQEGTQHEEHRDKQKPTHRHNCPFGAYWPLRRNRRVVPSTPSSPRSAGTTWRGASPAECRTVRSLRCGPGSKRLPGRTPGSGGVCARRPSCCSCSPALAVFGPRGAAWCVASARTIATVIRSWRCH